MNSPLCYGHAGKVKATILLIWYNGANEKEIMYCESCFNRALRNINHARGWRMVSHRPL